VSQLKPPQPAKLVIGFFLQNKDLAVPVIEDLIQRMGDVDIISSWFPFDQTSYYQEEMGSPLFRRILAFQTLIKQSVLPDVKHITNAIEQKYMQDSRRLVNIDPGYLLFERFVLATGKNFSHRIYIGRKIYADLTLVYRKGKFRSLPWTYPDYAGSAIQTFLLKVRDKYASDLKLTDREG
jgi:hypothetical protein